MSDENKILGPDGEVLDATPDLIEDFMPHGTALVVRDVEDATEIAQVLDAYDVEQILQEAQKGLLKKSLFDFPQGGERVVDLSYAGVLEVIRLMNWTGKVKIAVDSGSLVFAKEVQDGQPLVRAQVYAHDEVTGFGAFGISTEPERMRLKDSTANRYREDGKPVADDNTVFDPFSYTKAASKAQRNALKTCIPEVIRQTLIAQYLGDSRRIQHVRSAAEQKVLDAAPQLTSPEAVALREECAAIYGRIRELCDGRGKAALTPAQYHAYMVQSQGALDTLTSMRDYLLTREQQIPVELAAADRQALAVESATKVPCPNCEQPAGKFCRGIKGNHPERIAARLEQIPMPEAVA